MDTGADISVMKRRVAEEARVTDHTLIGGASLAGFAGSEVAPENLAQTALDLGGKTTTGTLVILETLAHDVLLGRDLLAEWGAVVDVERKRDTFARLEVELAFSPIAMPD